MQRERHNSDAGHDRNVGDGQEWSIAPGMTRTPLYDEWLKMQADPRAAEARVVDQIPLRRLALPSDVAGAVAYLASDEASYITGTSLPIDGGYTAQ